MGSPSIEFNGIELNEIICQIDGLVEKRHNSSVLAMELHIFIPPPNEVGGGVYWIHLVRLSVRLSVDGMVSGA